MPRGMQCCISALIVVAVIVTILVVAVVVLLNMTPAKLKLSQVEIQGVTIEELGLADTKIIDILKQIKDLTSFKEDEIITNPYDAEQEKIIAENDLAGSSAESDYSIIFTQDVTYNANYVKTFKDTTLAYIVNKAVQDASESDASYAKKLQDAGVSIKEIIIGNNEGTGTLSITAQINIKEYVEELNLSSLFKSDSIYITVDSTFTVGSEGATAGQMQAQSKAVKVNGKDNALTKALVKTVGDKFAESTGEELGQSMANAISSVVNHLGRIGTSEKDVQGVAIAPSYGMSGVIDHYVTLITHTPLKS